MADPSAAEELERLHSRLDVLLEARTTHEAALRRPDLPTDATARLQEVVRINREIDALRARILELGGGTTDRVHDGLRRSLAAIELEEAPTSAYVPDEPAPPLTPYEPEPPWTPQPPAEFAAPIGDFDEPPRSSAFVNVAAVVVGIGLAFGVAFLTGIL